MAISSPGVASGYAPGQIKICIFPQAMPQAIYSTIISLRRKFSPRRRLRLCPRANKNLHIPSGPRRRLRLCPRANKNLHIPSGNLAPGVASGYAPGQIKICIFPQGMPQAIYSTIISLRRPQASPQAMPQGN
ncbi:hypothetical protein T03_10027 [Trichinella britovi]|uniref:Uncharacterized protein n=1 Tax=Trichinella britovi TaxID=45882 RepID=A0A0V1CFS8_TRIBR|nr:hypothetical protein T03_10027 [Trichinella britovi]